MSKQRVIALDVMSGDHGPRSRIHAALRLLDSCSSLHFILVGDRRLIRESLANCKPDHHSHLTVIHSEQIVAMDDRPSHALRRKQDSSMWRALEQVSIGVADACVSAGNTGALMAMGRYLLKTMPGIDRPAIIGQLPAYDRRTLMLDLGANVDCTSEHLYQFAVLGSLMLSEVYGVDSPVIGVLNVGEENSKGVERVRIAQQLIDANPALNSAGFVEGHDLFRGKVDLVVCDGFTGNVALKASEGAAELVCKRIQNRLASSLWSRLQSLLVRPLLSSLFNELDPGRYNGASLLGLQGVVVKSHGAATQEQFGFAIEQAMIEVGQQAIQKMNDRLEDLL